VGGGLDDPSPFDIVIDAFQVLPNLFAPDLQGFHLIVVIEILAKMPFSSSLQPLLSPSRQSTSRCWRVPASPPVQPDKAGLIEVVLAGEDNDIGGIRLSHPGLGMQPGRWTRVAPCEQQSSTRSLIRR